MLLVPGQVLTIFNDEGMAEERDMNPFIPSLIDEAREREQQRLSEAERWRQAQPPGTERFSRVDRVRVRVGDWLIAAGQHLKAAARPEPHCTN